MEVLSDILKAMHVECSVYFCDHLASPWSLEMAEPEAANFHHVRRGECWLESDGKVVRLGPGDLAFLASDKDHKLSSCAPNGEHPADGSETLLLCGYFRFDHHLDTPLVKEFPSFSVIREEEIIKHRWLKATLDQLSAEYMAQKPGSEIVVNKLTEIVLVELIRIDFARKEQGRFVAALSDQQIAKALALLHSKPDVDWTLESMATQIGMSRAAFAKRFKDLVGEPMFAYMTSLRVQRAKNLLLKSALPIYEVANRVGYQSELAFTKTFKKHTGVTPTRFRNNQSD